VRSMILRLIEQNGKKKNGNYSKLVGMWINCMNCMWHVQFLNITAINYDVGLSKSNCKLFSLSWFIDTQSRATPSIICHLCHIYIVSRAVNFLSTVTLNMLLS
jgi:hypothetical protein